MYIMHIIKSTYTRKCTVILFLGREGGKNKKIRKGNSKHGGNKGLMLIQERLLQAWVINAEFYMNRLHYLIGRGVSPYGLICET
jgi:hypothetical protein